MRSGSRTRSVFGLVIGVVVLVAIPWFLYRADIERLLGHTVTVEATVTDLNSTRPTARQSSDSLRWWHQHFDLTWVDDTGATHTGTATVVSRRGAGLAPGQVVPAQWVPGTDLITVATVEQSVAAIAWPFTAAVMALIVGFFVLACDARSRGPCPAADANGAHPCRKLLTGNNLGSHSGAGEPGCG